ncbi:MAG TPA: heme A synthase [Gammaproteobacteria bacterium]|nr:heme A synthase [Gammaproteobacteria bacterium]
MDQNELKNRRQLGLWLALCSVLIFAMVILGGVTRLTGSGLSMVDWRPIMGVLPPISDTQWQSTFEMYQQSPEYLKKNMHFDLPEFKSIFWFEYGHRLLGRTIGIVFLLPFLFFLVRRQIKPELIPRFVLMFVLGGLQGVLGWYMVKSGLVNDPHVSQYRLTAHLAAALLIYVYILWHTFVFLFPPSNEAGRHSPALFNRGLAVLGLVIVTILSGGFVAGLKAGFAYNTFPLMDGHLIPQAYLMLQPAWLNIFENIAAVQFNHRVLAISTLIIVLAYWWWIRQAVLPARTRHLANLLAIFVLIQVGLGISTLLLHVPVALASMHQAGALIVLSLLVLLLQQLHTHRRVQS